MSAAQSNLDAPGYGYDIVVATTQLGINGTMKEYLFEVGQRQVPPPVVTCVYTGDNFTSRPIDYERLLELSHGSDPFSVPDGADPKTDQDLLNLAAAGFVFGFRLQVGIPPMVAPEDVPNPVRLIGDGSIYFTMLSAQLDAVWFDPGTGWTPVRSWHSSSQNDGDQAWAFISEGSLSWVTVPAAQYGTLPPAVQQQVASTDGAFSVQQLMFDLSAGRLVASPDIDGGRGGPASAMMMDYVYPTYVSQLQALVGNPVLGCAIVQRSTEPSPTELPITSMAMGWTPVVGSDGTPIPNPTADQQQLTTLNYYCATDNHALPAPKPFTWNWVDDADKDDYDGVVAIGRQTLAAKIRDQMLPNVVANCYLPYVRVSIDFNLAANITMNVKPGGTPSSQIFVQDAGPGQLQVLVFTFHAHDQDAGNPSWYGTASLDTDYQVSVTFGGNTITVDQRQVFNAVVTAAGSKTTGSPVDIHRRDTCTLTVDDHGQLLATMATPIPATNNASESTENWWGQMDGGSDTGSLYSSTAAIMAGTVGTMLNSLPFTIFQYLVFPGGQSFSYQSVEFAPMGDLVAYIIYSDPDGDPYLPPLPGQVCGADRLNDGQWLGNDGYLVSANQMYAAYLQDDSNFVLCHTDGDGHPDLSRPYWSVYADAVGKVIGHGAAPCYAVMQSDGNFVLYNGKSPLSPGPAYWAVNAGLPTLGTFAAVMKDDGNFAVYTREPGSGATDLIDLVWQTSIGHISQQGAATQ